MLRIGFFLFGLMAVSVATQMYTTEYKTLHGHAIISNTFIQQLFSMIVSSRLKCLGRCTSNSNCQLVTFVGGNWQPLLHHIIPILHGLKLGQPNLARKSPPSYYTAPTGVFFSGDFTFIAWVKLYELVWYSRVRQNSQVYLQHKTTTLIKFVFSIKSSSTSATVKV
jgi:hypothetical protein